MNTPHAFFTNQCSLRSLARLLRPAGVGLLATLAFTLLAAMGASIASSAEINSNGVGGGMWNDTSTWRGSQIPKAEDDVTIARGDVVTFDRNDHERVSCNKLFIDPNGSLTFKTASGKITMVVADAIESYGSIKIDAARTQGDVIELRMLGETPPQRKLTLMRGASLTVAGARFLNNEDATAIIRAHPGKDGFTQTSQAMLIAADGQVAIDIHNTRLDGVTIQAYNIDNTNVIEGQRLNIIGNYFNGRSSILISSCDTPVIADNTFINTYEGRIDMNAIHVISTPLATIRNNVIKANISRGIYGNVLTDPLIENNHIENASTGIMVVHSRNVMIQQNTAVNCKIGYYMRVKSGVLRDCVTDNCQTPIQAVSSNQQFINNTILNLVKDQPLLSNQGSTSILYNTQIQPGDVTLRNDNHINEVVIAHQPLIVRVKGNIPPGSVVEVVPTDPGMTFKKSYPPVVNSPASLDATGLTPTMITNSAIMLRSWQLIDKEILDPKAKPAQGKAAIPTYHVRVLGPRTSADKPDRPVLASTTAKPDPTWHRKDLADRSPMVEITLP